MAQFFLDVRIGGSLQNDDDTKDQPIKARPKRVWLRRVFFGFLILFVLLVLFHRPIIFEGTRYFIIRAAKQQNLDLTYEMGGSIFTTLTVAQLKAVPTEQGPIQRLEIGAIDLRYSLLDLLRRGPSGFLEELVVKNVFVELTPGEPLPPDEAQKPQRLKFPALFPEVLKLENLNLIVHWPHDDTVLEGFSLTLFPDRPGSLQVERLDIAGLGQWTQITAATSYRNRNLLLTDLQLDKEIDLRTFNLDLTRLEDRKVGVGVEGTFFAAPVSLKALVSGINADNDLTLEASVGALDFARVWKYLKRPPFVLGGLDELKLELRGRPSDPSGWTGQVSAGLSRLEVEGNVLGTVSAGITMKDGQADVSGQVKFDDANSLNLTATAGLPKKLDGFVKTLAEGRIEVSLPEAGRLTFSRPVVVAGDAVVGVDFSLAKGWLTARTTVDSTALSVAGADLSKTQLVVDLRKNLTRSSLFEDLTTELDGTISSVRFGGYEAESLRIEADGDGENVTITELTLAKGKNSARVTAGFSIPDDLTKWRDQPLAATVAIEAPDLAAFAEETGGQELTGALTVNGRVKVLRRQVDGTLVIDGEKIRFNGLPVDRLKVEATAEGNRADVTGLEIVLDAKNWLAGSGRLDWEKDLKYQGSLQAKMEEVSVFQPLLKPEAESLGGSVVANWTGSGDLAGPAHTGYANFHLAGGKWGPYEKLSADFTTSYSADYISIPNLSIRAGSLGEADLALFWNNQRLEIFNVSVRQGPATLLTGTLEIPLRLAALPDVNAMIPSDEPLQLALQTKDLDLGKLAWPGSSETPPVAGVINMNVSGAGTLAELTAQLGLKVTELKTAAVKDIDPAEVTLNLSLAKDDRLTIDGTVAQNLIQPLKIAGVVPLDLAAIKAKQKVDLQTPVDLTVTLPESSLSAIATLAQPVRSSPGTVEAAIKVAGTIGKPDLSGRIAAHLEALRFEDPSLPPINEVELQIDLAKNTVTLTRCGGVVAGGNFLASGSIDFAALTKPVLDLRLGARNVLALQDDSLVVRLSTDLTVAGPFDAGTVAGTVWVTRSRFFKNVDILPIALAGRPAPQPPADPPVISFRGPPLRDWKFDVGIRTLDPFLVQSNLANGRIVMEMKLGGTGLAPWLEGDVTIENLTATLPFSRLQIENGQIFFHRDEPFLPQLDIRGTSTVGAYDVAVFISGSAQDPNAVFSSDPPLSQADIVTLLATGLTPDTLTNDPNALAGRAAMLVFQKFYNRIFRRGKPPVENDSFLSKIRFDVGIADPKTGRQSTTIGLPLSKNIVLSGGLDVGGNFQGQVKYLIRFK